ncbi:MAG: 4Fe-4S binding protein [Firmicutes bacterium]|nr:4Fe-4S binding protein [Bacillota bacterium]
MIRKIIKIDESKCNGCGACAIACHEGAIEMIDGVAKLTREDYCDGLGDCLPACPTDAITFEEREALAYDEDAVLMAKAEKEIEAGYGCAGAQVHSIGGGCAGGHDHSAGGCCSGGHDHAHGAGGCCSGGGCCGGDDDWDDWEEDLVVPSELRQWPVQIKLVPTNAPFFDRAHVLIAADCTAYAYGNFHHDFMMDRITLIGCTKLDDVDYTEKLAEIFTKNDIKTVVVTRMQVPCCGGMENTVRNAIALSGKQIPLSVVVISSDGDIIDVR